MCFGGDDSAEKAAAEARQREAARQAKLSQGRSSIDSALAGFNDDYYNKVSGDYMNWALPQLEDQYSTAKKNLVYALSRGGNLQSTSAAEKMANLASEYAKNKENLENQATGYSTSQKKSVENARTNLLSVLSSTEDPNTVADSATRQAQALSQAPTYDMLGSLFSDIAGTINKINNARTTASALTGKGSSLFSSSGSGRVVN